MKNRNRSQSLNFRRALCVVLAIVAVPIEAGVLLVQPAWRGLYPPLRGVVLADDAELLGSRLQAEDADPTVVSVHLPPAGRRVRHWTESAIDLSTIP